jgi:hypothetical protein
MTLEKWLLLPVFLHFVMVFVIAVMMGRARFKAVSSGRVKRSDILVNSNNWPDDILQISNNFNNQFQAPMLWYALTAFALITKVVDPVLIALSWIFLLSRVAHSAIHLTSNKLPDRFYAYLLGVTVLGIAWLWFAYRFFVAG